MPEILIKLNGLLNFPTHLRPDETLGTDDTKHPVLKELRYENSTHYLSIVREIAYYRIGLQTVHVHIYIFKKRSDKIQADIVRMHTL